MAVIPQIVTSPGAVPSTGGSQVRVSPQVDVRAPADPSQALGAAASIESQAFQTTARAGEKLADYGEQFADQYVKAKLNVDAANHQADLSKQLHEAEFESSKIADRAAATTDFDQRAAKIKDDFAAKDVNPQVRAAVDASLPNQIALRRASAQNASFGLESKAQVGQLISNIDQYNKQAIDAQDPRLTETLIQQANDAIDGRVAGGWLSAEVAAKMKVDFGSNVYLTKIEVAMQKDMASGIALYDATKGKLNARDSAKAAVMVEDRRKHVEADSTVSSAMPVFGGDEKDRVHRAIVGQESGGRQVDASGNILTSSKGALGAGQITPGTFAQFAKPGESITNKEDNLRVSKRITDHYMEKYNGDWQRAAVAYFSGEGNVAPAGSPTPWKVDSSDGRVKTSEYVNQVGARLGGAAAPQGDQLAQWKIDGYRYIQSLVDDKTLDPEARNRQISIANQRLNIGNSIVLEQRKSAADTGEALAIKLNTGQYTIGGFQQVSDQFRAAGDNSNADTYQVLANNEAQLIEDSKNPPAQRSAASMLLPGAGGRIAAQQHAQVLADATERRRLEAAHRTENRQSGAAEEKIIDDSIGTDVNPEALKQNMRNTLAYYTAAGDDAKVERLKEKFNAMLDGAIMQKLPPAERNRLKLELQEIANSKDGLSIRDSTLLKILDRKETDNQQRWDQDPLTAAHNIGPRYGGISLQPFNTNVLQDRDAAQLWANQRLHDLRQATYRRDGSVSVLPANYFTPTEMSDITQKLATMKPLEAKMFLANLAAVVPAQAIALIGQQMSQKDPVSDSYAGALGLFARNKKDDVEIGKRVIDGMNWRTKGGEDGKSRIDVNAALFTAIDNQLGGARTGMTPDAIRMQNNVIISNYVALTAGSPDRAAIKPDQLSQAITEIVGKRANINGADTLIARELEPYQVRNGLASIGPADVASLRASSDGKPITDATIRQRGQIVPYGDGLYTVVIPDPLKAARMAQVIDNTTGRPWVIDIHPLIARGDTTNRASRSENPPSMPRSTRGIPVIVPTEPVPPQ